MLSVLPSSKWNYATAAHLLNRAGFGATPAEIEKFAALTPEKAVSSLLDYEEIPDTTPNPEWAKPDTTRFERFQKARNATPEERKTLQREEQRRQREHLVELRQWWLQRMAKGPRPLQEKLTLFWHGHFATSAQKVKDAYLMWLQNDTFRRNASGDWLVLLTEVSKDPAMLIWLDQAQSRREHPNENFAREVMELFTLGEGHYTEKDVTEAARSFTGWSFNRQSEEFVNRPPMHDREPKTVFGKTGNFNGDDILRMIVNQPQASEFITAKLWKFFASETPPEGVVQELAAEFRKAGNNFKPMLRQLLLSEVFYSDSVVRQQVKSPVQWLVGSVKLLERDLPAPMISGNALRLLGQELLAPPNVKGWDGGLSWINTSNLLNRYNFAAFLVSGENTFAGPGMARPGGAPKQRKDLPIQRFFRGKQIDVDKILAKEDRKDTETLVRALERRFIQAPLRERQEKTLREYLVAKEKMDDHDLMHTIRLIMSTPEYQLT